MPKNKFEPGDVIILFEGSKLEIVAKIISVQLANYEVEMLRPMRMQSGLTIQLVDRHAEIAPEAVRILYGK